MRKVNSLRGKWQNVAFFLTALLIVVADQLSKLWVRSNLALGESLPETGLFRLTHIYNTGAVFGLFQGQSFPLIIVAGIGIVVVLLFTLLFYHRFPLLDNRLGKPALGLLLGGSIGNLIDRLRFGGVTDFIDVGIGGYRWPAFNIADSAVVVGTIIFAYCLLRLARAWKTDLST